MFTVVITVYPATLQNTNLDFIEDR